jgi:hypothetical protein
MADQFAYHDVRIPIDKIDRIAAYKAPLHPAPPIGSFDRM